MRKIKKMIMSLMGDVISCFNKYACFAGRAPRSEFWGFIVFNVLAVCFLYGAGNVTMILEQGDPVFLWILSGFYAFATIIPTLAVMARRLHDTGRSGLNLLWLFLPAAGWIVLAVFMLGKGTGGANRYGPEP